MTSPKHIRSLLLVLLLSTRFGQADEMDQAVRAALDEPPAGQPVLFQPSFVLFNHTLGITPVETTRVKKGRYAVTGKLTHSKPDGGEDVLDYQIKRDQGTVTELTIRMNNGEWQPLAPSFRKILGQFIEGVELPSEKQGEINQALREQIDGSWQRAAEYFIIQVATRHC